MRSRFLWAVWPALFLAIGAPWASADEGDEEDAGHPVAAAGDGGDHCQPGHCASCCSLGGCCDNGCGCCNAGCCGGCCGAYCGCCPRLLGFIAQSDQRFCDFISPITNPVYFEDPRTLSEARFIYLSHKLPGALGGGTVNAYAMQVRAALTQDLSIIATKDGFVTASSAVPHNDGWLDVNAGLKYNLYADPCAQQLLSAGVVYELPVGSPRALQGNGDGVFHMFLSGGTQMGETSHWISTFGWRLPCDARDNSQMIYWSNHWDKQIGCSGWYVLGEVNWYHWVASGAGGLAGVEGLDIYNLGSTNVAGNNIVTGAVGLKYKPTQLQEIGLAYEIPLTDRRDILQNRINANWIFRY